MRSLKPVSTGGMRILLTQARPQRQRHDIGSSIDTSEKGPAQEMFLTQVARVLFKKQLEFRLPVSGFREGFVIAARDTRANNEG